MLFIVLMSPKPTQLLLENNQAAINGIRATGAQQLILAPGNGFTGGHSFTQVTGQNDAPSSDFLNKLVDPIKNTAIDIHEVSYPASGRERASNDWIVSRSVTVLYLILAQLELDFWGPDIDFSGGHAECTQPGPANLANVTAWLKENNLK
jgi:endoglucanase